MSVTVDHFFALRVAAISGCFTVAGFVTSAIWGTVTPPWSTLAIGFALGAEVDLIGYLTVRYFGLAACGRLHGVLYGSFILGTGFSPLAIVRPASAFRGYTFALGAAQASSG